MKQQSPEWLESPPMVLLYQRHAPTLFAYLHQQLSSVEDAEDLLVEVFVAALESDPFFTLVEQQQQAWLWRVARNKVVDVYRRRHPRHKAPLSAIDQTSFEPQDQSPEEIVLQQEAVSHLHLLIQQLPALQQEVLQLRFSTNLRCAQIASRLRKPEGTVRSILARTLNHLRRLYEKEETRS